MMKRLLITGANRGLGAMCRNRLGHLAEIIRVSGRRDLAPAAENEELFFCDLSDKDAVHEMVEGCDGAAARPMRPMSVLGSPPASFRQVTPPSVVLWIPPPGPPPSWVQTWRLRW